MLLLYSLLCCFSFSFLDGIEFVRSANNVILCAGDESGFLHPKYFDRVVDVSNGELLKI